MADPYLEQLIVCHSCKRSFVFDGHIRCVECRNDTKPCPHFFQLPEAIIATCDVPLHRNIFDEPPEYVPHDSHMASIPEAYILWDSGSQFDGVRHDE